MSLIENIGGALRMSFVMLWEILWALCLGFLISAAIQAIVPKKQVSKLLPDDSPRSLTIAALLGAASSSCSYAAVAIARSLFRKGANFTSAIAFEFASTNLVIELGILLVLMLGWQFAAAEFVGGILMIVLLAIMFRMFLKPRMIEEARKQADRGLPGSMEGHADMDMSVTIRGSLWTRLRSSEGLTSISHYFVMDWVSVWKDIALGLLLAGLLAILVPSSAWQNLFYTGHGATSRIWGAIIGPLVSMISFVCSIGNVPLAAVLWNGGISFGGVIAFIFADLLILPILNIHRKYYGMKMMLFLCITSYVAMVAAGLGVDYLFTSLGIAPNVHHAIVSNEGITWNYTTYLNIGFLVLTVAVILRFFRTGGMHMLRAMEANPNTHHVHEHHSRQPHAEAHVH